VKSELGCWSEVAQGIPDFRQEKVRELFLGDREDTLYPQLLLLNGDWGRICFDFLKVYSKVSTIFFPEFSDVWIGSDEWMCRSWKLGFEWQKMGNLFSLD